MGIFRRPASGVPAGDAIPFAAGEEYHLFFLTSPACTKHYPERVRTSWFHARSRDLVDWEELPVALTPGSGDEPDSDGVWTGSVIERDDRYHLFYTGHRIDSATPQTICRATSEDLVHFVKDRSNPILAPDTARYESVDWRDPYVFWNEEERCYWMLIAARLADGPRWRRGCIALATSPDLELWSLEDQPLYAPGTTLCPECPEMFRLEHSWYLVYSRFSEQAQTMYRVAKAPRGPWRVSDGDALDGRRWYAAKSVPELRKSARVFFGWVHERVDASDEGAWQWGGDFGVPREVCAEREGLLTARLPEAHQARFARELAYVVGGPNSAPREESPRSLALEAYGALDYRFMDTDTRDYLFECRIAPQGRVGGFGLLFRVNDDLGGYVFAFDPIQSTVSLVRWPQPLDKFWGRIGRSRRGAA